jgi:hypothetical protein
MSRVDPSSTSRVSPTTFTTITHLRQPYNRTHSHHSIITAYHSTVTKTEEAGVVHRQRQTTNPTARNKTQQNAPDEKAKKKNDKNNKKKRKRKRKRKISLKRSLATSKQRFPNRTNYKRKTGARLKKKG